jgi:hypothetical protein
MRRPRPVPPLRLPYQKTFIAICLIGFLICMALIFGGCASSRLLDAGVVISGVADLTTTRMAIHSGTGQEANPVMGDSAWRQGLIKSFGIGAVLGSAALVDHQGRKTLSRIIKIAAMGVWVSATVNNVLVMRR